MKKNVSVSYKVKVIAEDGHFFCDPMCPQVYMMGKNFSGDDKVERCRLFETTNSWVGKLQFVPHDCERMLTKVAKVKPPKRKEHNWKHKVHSSHTMSKEETQIMSPAGTPRFYIYRRCYECGAEQYEHAAGKFCEDRLLVECEGEI